MIIILGDPRRPYPLDIEMRCGALGQISSKNSDEDFEADRKVEGKCIFHLFHLHIRFFFHLLCYSIFALICKKLCIEQSKDALSLKCAVMFTFIT